MVIYYFNIVLIVLKAEMEEERCLQSHLTQKIIPDLSSEEPQVEENFCYIGTVTPSVNMEKGLQSDIKNVSSMHLKLLNKTLYVHSF